MSIDSPLTNHAITLISHIQKRRGASLMLVPRSKGLRIAQIVETSNAESPTPMSICYTQNRLLQQQ